MTTTKLPTGQANQILIDRQTVIRMPVRPLEAAGIAAAARRLDAAHRIGLPSPELIDVVDGPVGSAAMRTTLLPGLPLRDAHLEPSSWDRLAEDVSLFIEQLTAVEDVDWPEPRRWAELWACLAARCDEIDACIALDQTASHLLDAAWRSALTATGLQHTDLSAGNLLVDPASGALTGVVDWDGALLGDPALDLLAAQYLFPDSTWSKLLSTHPHLAIGLKRANTYVATWPLQELLFVLDRNRPDLVADSAARVSALVRPS